MNRVARFRLDPRDVRSDADYYDVVGDDRIFGCISLLGCHDVCPKNLPLQTQIAYLRRAMMKQGFIQGNAGKSIPIVKAPAAPALPAATTLKQRQEA